MIHLDDPVQPLAPQALKAPGGFAWWYAECADAEGNGIVLIWSFGLPFLPGYAQAARDGRPLLPRAHPTLNIAVYERGRPTLYLLREFEQADAHWDGDGQWRFGHSYIESRCEGGVRHLRASLNGEVSGHREPLRADVRIAGPVPSLPADTELLGRPADSAHRWTPLVGPAFGTARVELGADFRFALTGRAYHDHNAGTVPFHELGIQRWLWGHASLPSVERIFYVLWPSASPDSLDSPESDAAAKPVAVGLEMDRAGECSLRRDLRLELPADSRSTYGMRQVDRVTLHADADAGPWLDMDLVHRVDNGPFYLRFLGQGGAHDAPGRFASSAELIEPRRIDLGVHRPLVRMRVDSDQRRNSMWLPLFQGLSAGRARRLLRSWAASLETKPTLEFPS